MSLVELGRYGKTEADIIVGALEAQGIGAVAFDAGASIADGSQFLIPVRVMVLDEDLVAARALLAAPPLPDF